MCKNWSNIQNSVSEFNELMTAMIGAEMEATDIAKSDQMPLVDVDLVTAPRPQQTNMEEHQRDRDRRPRRRPRKQKIILRPDYGTDKALLPE